NSYDLSIQKAAAMAPLMPVIPDGSGIRDYFFADGSCEEHEFDGGHHERSHDGLTPPSPASVVHTALGQLPAVSAEGIVSLAELAGAAWSPGDAFTGTDGTWPITEPAPRSPTVEWALAGTGGQTPTDSNPATPDVTRPALGEWLVL
ncbi:MAG TPA: hypothetical protein VKD90_10810, partial [Gemmataceae bacterium]|nr:hypothetical protein [Gemmataceae bacterium]